MISKLKIALLQIAPCKTLEENLEKGIVCCRKAKERGADIALFPEMWSNGYNIYGRHFDEWKAEAISADSDFINTFGETAKELDMAVGITLLENTKMHLVIPLFFLTDLARKNLYMQKFIPVILMWNVI